MMFLDSSKVVIICLAQSMFPIWTSKYFQLSGLPIIESRSPNSVYVTGWRKSAIATLEWSDVRDGNVYLRGLRSKNGRPSYVPIVGELVQVIERRKDARSTKSGAGVLLSSLVFHRDGSSVAEFRKSWATACQKAGCEGRLFHDLRRSAARNLIRSGVTKDVAKQVGGWKTDSMFSRYNVTGEEDLRDAMQKVTIYNEGERQKIVSIAK
jgi:integrase